MALQIDQKYASKQARARRAPLSAEIDRRRNDTDGDATTLFLADLYFSFFQTSYDYLLYVYKKVQVFIGDLTCRETSEIITLASLGDDIPPQGLLAAQYLHGFLDILVFPSNLEFVVELILRSGEVPSAARIIRLH